VIQRRNDGQRTQRDVHTDSILRSHAGDLGPSLITHRNSMNLTKKVIFDFVDIFRRTVRYKMLCRCIFIQQFHYFTALKTKVTNNPENLAKKNKTRLQQIDVFITSQPFFEVNKKEHESEQIKLATNSQKVFSWHFIQNGTKFTGTWAHQISK